eukprot:TRINITY_DN873_c0_g1_i21.p1 TRINITY_DN873_c0_g1~~TRINITY_DN873_c0_g1_i21.p1  ORF type:complete len:119 (-),score=8.53 TRINITY_DN873_c0_g1_i21:114-470(-)
MAVIFSCYYFNIFLFSTVSSIFRLNYVKSTLTSVYSIWIFFKTVVSFYSLFVFFSFNPVRRCLGLYHFFTSFSSFRPPFLLFCFLSLSKMIIFLFVEILGVILAVIIIDGPLGEFDSF